MYKKSLSETDLLRIQRLCTNLRELRLCNGKTQIEVWNDMDRTLHLNTLIRIENSRKTSNAKNFTIVSLFRLADYYGIPIGQLLDID
jgi:transcriptional regulator with XRE-family HTH domain